MTQRTLTVTMLPSEMLSWESQVRQYPPRGPKGIEYYGGETTDGVVDCLLFRDKSGKVRGILNYFGQDFFDQTGRLIERALTAKVFVDPKFRRRGIATKLLSEAERRWLIDWEKIEYTPAGAGLVKKYLDVTVDPKRFRRRGTPKPPFTPADYAQRYGVSLVEAEQMYAANLVEAASRQYWINDTYQVSKKDIDNVTFLSVVRLDGEPVKEWTDLQSIKNELVGAEYEGIELFPAESRLVDTANQYHLWVYRDERYRLPVPSGEALRASEMERIEFEGLTVGKARFDDVYVLAVPWSEKTRDWRTMQKMKNALVGAEHEGFNILPAESRRSELSDRFYLFVYVDATVRVQVGWAERDVGEEAFPGQSQRPFNQVE